MELKFRAWEPNYDGRMHYSDQEHAKYKDESGKCSWHITTEGIHIELWNYSYGPNNPEMHKVIPEDQVIMQYTGLKDKNGKEIYEGDIIHQQAFDDLNSDYTALIKWGSVGFEQHLIIDGEVKGKVHTVQWRRPIEVIGNIHENPELLEE